MEGKMFSGSYKLYWDALAYRLLMDPTWLKWVGALMIMADDITLVIPENELGYFHDCATVATIERMTYIPKGVFTVANGTIPPNFLKAFAMAQPDRIPFRDGHYSKNFATGATGELKIYYSTLGDEPVCHLIPDNGEFVIQDVDIVYLKTGVRIFATVVFPKRSPERILMELANADNLGRPGFEPIWKEVSWAKGFDIGPSEGFSDGSNTLIVLFIDRRTNHLMAVVNDGQPEVVEKGVRILFRGDTGSEVKDGHLATALTDSKLVDVCYYSDAKGVKLGKDFWLRETNPNLEPMFKAVCGMTQPAGKMVPFGFHFFDRSNPRGLVHQHRPNILYRRSHLEPTVLNAES